MKSAWNNRPWLGMKTIGLATLAAGILLMGQSLSAQQPGTRAVRLSDVDGQVQLSQGNTVLADRAPVNTPLFEGTRITTAEDGRAEVQFEDGSVARLAPNSSMTLTVLRQQGNVNDTAVELDSGLGYFELQGNSASGQMRVQFGSSSVTSSGFTVVRVDLDNLPGELAVFSGNAHLDGSNSMAVDLHGGESVRLSPADAGKYTLSENIEPNSWDAWNSDRDQALTAQQADRTQASNTQPNSDNPAWSDLDANGNWYDVPGQGYVWSPYEAMNGGWDPYGCGSWTWNPAFSYMWASCEPWGYLPYQFGMWNYYPGFGWGWMPGGGMPWWGYGGGGAWSANVGAAPLNYSAPIRPRGGPVRPVGGAPVRSGAYEPHPVISVNRLRENMQGGPIRVRNTPATIAGTTVQPVRPIAPRPMYNGMFGGGSRIAAPAGVNGRTAAGVHYGMYPAAPASGRAGATWNAAPRAYGGPTRSQGNYGGYYGGRPSAPSYGGAPAGRPSGGSYGGGSHGGGGYSGGGGSHGGGGFSGGGGGGFSGGGGGGFSGGGGGGHMGGGGGAPSGGGGHR